MAGAPPPGTIPALPLHPGVKREDVDGPGIVTSWLSDLQILLAQREFSRLSELFIEDSWWRDSVALTWDITSKHGLKTIGNHLAVSTGNLTDLQIITSGGLQPALVDMGGLFWIQSGFTFKSSHGNGRGYVRLANVGASDWKAWLVFTQLEQLPEEIAGHESSSTSGLDEPDVVIVGAGQSALALGAHLKKLGIRTVMFDKESRLGSAWLARYKTVKLHSPVYSDHYPFMKYPEHWPRWLSQDNIAEWMGQYSEAMDLDIRLNSNVTGVKYDESTRKYRVDVQSATAGSQTFFPRQVVLAMGIFSDPIMPNFPGQDLFKGQLYHTTEHRSAGLTTDLANKRIAIIGSSASSHDIAQDFVNHGAKSVAMIQRGGIYSLSTAAFEKFMMPLWNTPGITTEEADIIGSSIPTAVVRTMGFGMTKMICDHDKDMISGLKTAGLAVKTGDDGSTILDHQLVKGGSFYIDQGASQMIIDGRIKIHQCDGGAQKFNADGVILADGAHVDADIVIVATGFHRMCENVKKIMGEDVYKRAGGISFGTFNEEQERIGCWRPTAVPGFWYTTGSFQWNRQYSLPLSLQIAAVHKGLNDKHYQE